MNAGDDPKGTGGKPLVQGTASFSKFMNVLQAIAHEPGALDMARLIKRLPYPRGTLHRIVSALIAEDLVAENRTKGTYDLGPRLIHLASRSWEASDLRGAAHSHLEDLRNLTGETIHLAVPSGKGMVYIDKLESPRAVRMMSRIGTRVELYATAVGKAFLAALPEERARDLVAGLDLQSLTANTLIDENALYTDIRKTRERGYSCDNQENEVDIRCIGGAILDRSGAPVGAISLSIPVYRYDEERARHYAEKVQEAVRAISASLAQVH